MLWKTILYMNNFKETFYKIGILYNNFREPCFKIAFNLSIIHALSIIIVYLASLKINLKIMTWEIWRYYPFFKLLIIVSLIMLISYIFIIIVSYLLAFLFYIYFSIIYLYSYSSCIVVKYFEIHMLIVDFWVKNLYDATFFYLCVAMILSYVPFDKYLLYTKKKKD